MAFGQYVAIKIEKIAGKSDKHKIICYQVVEQAMVSESGAAVW